MDMSDFKDVMGKVFKGCGCLSIGFVVLCVLVGIFADDEENTDVTDETTQKTEQVEKKDSVIVNEPLEGDPYKELDELIGLNSVKKEVRSLANFVKLQKQREALTWCSMDRQVQVRLPWPVSSGVSIKTSAC